MRFHEANKSLSCEKFTIKAQQKLEGSQLGAAMALHDGKTINLDACIFQTVLKDDLD